MAFPLYELTKTSVREKAKKLSAEMANNRILHNGDPLNMRLWFYAFIAYKRLLSYPGNSPALSIDDIEEYRLGISASIQNIINGMYSLESAINELNKYIIKFPDARVFASAVLFDIANNYTDVEQPSGTPQSVTNLAKTILAVQDGDNVADICSGRGDFMTSVFLENQNISFTGYELNIFIAALSEMRAEILGENAKIIRGDALSSLEEHKEAKYDKIFANFPFKKRFFGDSNIKLQSSSLNRTRTYDWLFIDAICNHLTENGKGVAVMLDGMLSNITDRKEREYFVKNGMIEAVISLPTNLFSDTGVNLSLVVFSKHNSHVKFVDASDIYDYPENESKQPCAPQRVFSNDNIKSIINALEKDGDNSFTLSTGKIEENNYSLAVKKYRTGLKQYSNGVKLSEIATILRCTGNYKETANSKRSFTGLQFLKIADIAHGLIPDELLSLPDSSYKPSMVCLEKLDIVISRNGTTGKAAIYEGGQDRKIIPSGNLLIIRPDIQKVNPYYLLAFLLSEEGAKTIEYITTGSVIKTISNASLSGIIVPLESYSKQDEVAKKIIAAQTELKMYRIRFADAEQKIVTAFSDAEEKC